MKIAQVTPLYSPQIGGIASHVKKLSEKLVEKGLDITVITTDYSGRLPKTEIINSVPVRRFRSIAPNNAYHFCPQIYSYLMKSNYTIIHAQAYHSFVSLIAAQAKRDSKFVLTPHTWGFTHIFPRNVYLRFYMPFGKHVYNVADKVIAVSQLEGSWIQNNFKLPEEKVIYIPHPIEILETSQMSRKDNSVFNIGYVGRMDPWKRVDILIRAFRLLSESDKKTQLFIAGDGPCMGSLRELAGSTENIHFLGRVSHDKVKEFLPSMDVLVLPSEIEVSPVVAYEAMASKVATITSGVGDLSLLEDGKTCLFTKLDHFDLAEKIKLLVENKALRQAIAENGQNLIRSKFEESKIINLYVSLFTDLANT